MSDFEFREGAIMGFSVTFVCSMVVLLIVSCYVASTQTDYIHQQAIERGFGEYRVDQKTQKVEFHWKDTVEK